MTIRETFNNFYESTPVQVALGCVPVVNLIVGAQQISEHSHNFKELNERIQHIAVEKLKQPDENSVSKTASLKSEENWKYYRGIAQLFWIPGLILYGIASALSYMGSMRNQESTSKDDELKHIDKELENENTIGGLHIEVKDDSEKIFKEKELLSNISLVQHFKREDIPPTLIKENVSNLELENKKSTIQENNHPKTHDNGRDKSTLKTDEKKLSQLDKKKLEKSLKMNEDELIKLNDQKKDLMKNSLKLEKTLEKKIKNLAEIGKMEKKLDKEINQDLENHFDTVRGYGEIPDRSQKTRDKLIENSYGHKIRNLKKIRGVIDGEISTIKNSIEENIKALEECSKNIDTLKKNMEL